MRHDRDALGAGVLVLLPDGGALGGVTVWADEVAGALEARGTRAVVVRSEGSIEACLASVRGGLVSLAERGARRCVIMPQLSGNAYAAAVAASFNRPETCVVGFLHSMLRYDIALLGRFGPALSMVGCVSEAARWCLAGVVSDDAVRVVRTGVEDVGMWARGGAHRPVRLIYTGRLDAFQKRVLALPMIVALLRDRGIEADLSVVGDGPSAGALRDAADLGIGLRMLGSMDRASVRSVLAEHDFLLLPSRSEGLGLSRIEAALAGCVPVVTPGGGAEGIEHLVSGVVVDAGAELDDASVAERFAAAIQEALGLDVAGLRARSRGAAARLSCPARFADGLEDLVVSAFARAADGPALARLAADPVAAARVTVPLDASERAAAVFREIGARFADARVVVHGRGEHSEAIAGVLDGAGIVAFCDDDPSVVGCSYLGKPVLSPDDLASVGATDVVISSWLHQDAIWDRRDAYGDVRVHRLYDGGRSVQALPTGR